jgi:hypothetical protein
MQQLAFGDVTDFMHGRMNGKDESPIRISCRGIIVFQEA